MNATWAVIRACCFAGAVLFAASCVAAEPDPVEARISALRSELGSTATAADAEMKSQVEAAIKDLEVIKENYLKEENIREVVNVETQILNLRRAAIGKSPIVRFQEFMPTPVNSAPEEGTSRVGRVSRPDVRSTTPQKDPLEPVLITPEKLSDLELPASAAVGKSIVKPTLTSADGLKITPFDVKAPELVGDLLWSPKGDAFFALTTNGLLRRIVMQDDGFVEERRIDLARRASDMAVSGVGLLVALSDLQEVWVVHPVTLEVRQRIAAPRVQRILSGPGLQFAIAAGTGERFGRQGTAVYLDLAKGVPVHQQSVPTQYARLTPDGKRYFALGGIEQLMSFRVENFRLVADQSTERIAQNGQDIFVSPDSKYVCLPSGGGNYGAGGYSTFVYPTDNLKKPAFTVHSGAYPRCMGFDPAAKLVYAQNHGVPLIVVSDTGIVKSEFQKIPLGNNLVLSDTRRCVAHPQGRKLLMTGGNHLVFVELPE